MPVTYIRYRRLLRQNELWVSTNYVGKLYFCLGVCSKKVTELSKVVNINPNLVLISNHLVYYTSH